MPPPADAADRPFMPMPPHRVYADFLTAGEHAALLDWTLASEARFIASRLRDRVVNPEVRRSLSLRELGRSGEALTGRLAAEAETFVRDLRVSPFALGRIELELIAHGDGDRFARHIDTFTGQQLPGRARVLSCVYYFHREPKGFADGALRIHAFGDADAGGFVDIEPRQNTLLVFPAWAPHEVRPVSCPSGAFADARFSVNCWLHRQTDT
ncbi:MAG TPA: 2OG-Fe(II) oxygenase [Caulobacteraceae bacterium]|jgi:Rps23 Pro-64 3,4-dihydroxylase Tpa1-like proline 4-hydroxylase